jgi:hypothetical protein
VGGVIDLEGSQIDTRQSVRDGALGRALQRALVATPEWWETVVSIVVPTLSDKDGGFALANKRTVPRARDDGRVSNLRLRGQARPGSNTDFIYFAGSKVAPPASVGLPRIRIDLTGSVLRSLATDPTYPQTKLLVIPDTEENRNVVSSWLSGTPIPPWEADWGDPNRKLRLVVKKAECEVTGLVLDGKWADHTGLEAARRLLLTRYDLRVGLWDLALNPLLRTSVLAPLSTPPIPSHVAAAPKSARHRAEQEAGAIERALFRNLADAGWTHNKGLVHEVVDVPRKYGEANHPHLRVRVFRNAVRVLAWHWHYTTYDINAFVDRRSSDFDAVSALPTRSRLGASSAEAIRPMVHDQALNYHAERMVEDPRWVPLWLVDKGWTDLDVDWKVLGLDIRDKTPGWVRLLADAGAEALRTLREGLRLITGPARAR